MAILRIGYEARETESRWKPLGRQVPLIGLALVLLPWLIFGTFIWDFTPDTFVVPLSDSVFSFFSMVVADHRVVIPQSLMHPFLLFSSFLSPLFLGLTFLVSYFLFSGKPITRLVLALAFTVCYYRFGAPGLPSNSILQILIPLIGLYPFFQSPSPLILWGLATVGVVLVSAHPALGFPIFWMTFSLTAGFSMSFVFADQGFIQHRWRTRVLNTANTAIGMSVLIFWISLFFWQNYPLEAWLTPTSRPHYLIWIGSLLCAYLAYIRPWTIYRWIAVTTLLHGLYFSSTLDPLLPFIYCFLLQRAFYETDLAAKLSPFRFMPVGILGVLACVWLFVSEAAHFQAERSFQPEWVSALHEIKARAPNKKWVVIGRGFDFISHFISTDLARSDELLLESSENNFSSLLDHEGFENILVEKAYLIDFWRAWIFKGQSPDQSNASVISRLVDYQGKAIETKTIHLSEIKNFEVVKLERAPDFVWIRKKKPA